MVTEETITKIKRIITMARKLEWLQENPKGYPLMQLSEVEKCMIAMVEDCELDRMQEWYGDKLREGEDIKW